MPPSERSRKKGTHRNREKLLRHAVVVTHLEIHQHVVVARPTIIFVVLDEWHVLESEVGWRNRRHFVFLPEFLVGERDVVQDEFVCLSKHSEVLFNKDVEEGLRREIFNMVVDSRPSFI